MQQESNDLVFVSINSLIYRLPPRDIRFFTGLRRRELGGSEPIGKISDLVPKRKRSKPDGFGKVNLGKSKR